MGLFYAGAELQDGPAERASPEQHPRARQELPAADPGACRETATPSATDGPRQSHHQEQLAADMWGGVTGGCGDVTTIEIRYKYRGKLELYTN